MHILLHHSSNYQIITAIINAIRTGEQQKVFSPGFNGCLGGYPVYVGYRCGKLDAWIDETQFSFEEMETANMKSMALDGVENVSDGKLIYTDALIEKAYKAFGKQLPKEVKYEDIDETANFLINEIILPQLKNK